MDGADNWRCTYGGYPWLAVYCGCQTVQDIDLCTIDRQPAAAVTIDTMRIAGELDAIGGVT